MERLLDSGFPLIAVKVATVAALLAGIASLMMLADVRGHLLAREIETAPAIVIDDREPVEPVSQDFYGQTIDSLRFATILIAFAMEVGARLALRDAWAKCPRYMVEWEELREEQGTIRARMVHIAADITRLQDEPALIEARLWRDFYKAMLTHTVRSAMRKLSLVFVMFMLIPAARAAKPLTLNLVVALDLSKSVDVKSPDGKTEFKQDVDGVTRVLAEMPVGSHVTIIGITDRSLTQPYILLSASIPSDPGYFGERLDAARREVVLAWEQRSAKLHPTFSRTDILGALQLGSQIFFQSRAERHRNLMVLFSDMQNATAELNLEGPIGATAATTGRLLTRTPRPDLTNVEVFVLGAEVAGSTAEWMELKEFWTEYFEECRAHLLGYSVLRIPPTVR